MRTIDYDHVEYNPRLFEYVFRTPLEDLSTGAKFERGVEMIGTIVETAAPLIRPTTVAYSVADLHEDGAHEETLSNEAGLTSTDIVHAIRSTAATTATPRLTDFVLAASVRITLPDGIHYVADPDESPVYGPENGTSDEPRAPLEVVVQQPSVMRPSCTEEITITAHSNHWLKESEEARASGTTTLAALDQSRLVAVLSQLYDRIDPETISFETFETRDGLRPSVSSIPGVDVLGQRDDVEWVLENFEVHRLTETAIKFEYLGNQVYQLVSAPDSKIQTYLTDAHPPDRYPEGSTATVIYPNDRAEFVKNTRGVWAYESRSDL